MKDNKQQNLNIEKYADTLAKKAIVGDKHTEMRLNTLIIENVHLAVVVRRLKKKIAKRSRNRKVHNAKKGNTKLRGSVMTGLSNSTYSRNWRQTK